MDKSTATVSLHISEYEAMKYKIEQLEENFKKLTDNPEIMIISANDFIRSSSRHETRLQIINKKDEGIHYLGKIIQECIKKNEDLVKELTIINFEYRNLRYRLQDKYKIKDEDFKL